MAKEKDDYSLEEYLNLKRENSYYGGCLYSTG